ncbi:MAG TPA: hypothetical protein VLF79_02805 [Candidatus Saccharimonadales bacterium]|nr:hypothetical protein [Candidatus Saccharimonadales bacterium]
MISANIFKKASAGLAATLIGLLVSLGGANAIPYTGPTTPASPVPAFNVYTGNMPAPAPANGESDFYQGRVPANGDLNDTSTQYIDPVNTSCTNGKIMQLRVYVHNGASAEANNNGSGPSVAHGTKVKVSLPGTTASSFHSSATISANNAATVSDGLTINCNGQTVQLQYVNGSASQYSIGSGELPLSDSIVSTGVPIQSQHVPGDVWGCWNERVYVLLEVKVVIPTPPPPVVTATCDLLNVEANTDRKVTVNQFKYTASNANFKSVVINWGDSNSDTVTDASKVIGTSHQYASPGTYLIAAIVHFTANGKEITADGVQCQKQVTFFSPPNTPPTITPPPAEVTTASTPTTLVNTGPGSIAAIFAATTGAGTIAYRWLLGRRLNRQ